jgi:hypothetical protein
MNNVQAIVLQNTKVLVPNMAHKNFSETEEVIPAGTIITGHAQTLQGLRRGQPFNYRLFYTNDNKIIYLNKTKAMNNTETTFGADSQVTPTIVKIPLQSRLAKASSIGAISGAIIGYGYCKYKKQDNKKAMTYALIGGIVGYVAGLVIQNTRKETVSPSK